MKDIASVERMTPRQDQRLLEVVERERFRLLNFIRRRVPDPGDAEDVLQDVFYELVEANRLLMPIEEVTGWLFRVARNRITDLFRKKKPESFGDSVLDLLPSPDAGPEALYARSVLLDELANQRVSEATPRRDGEEGLLHPRHAVLLHERATPDLVADDDLRDQREAAAFAREQAEHRHVVHLCRDERSDASGVEKTVERDAHVALQARHGDRNGGAILRESKHLALP